MSSSDADAILAAALAAEIAAWTEAGQRVVDLFDPAKPRVDPGLLRLVAEAASSAHASLRAKLAEETARAARAERERDEVLAERDHLATLTDESPRVRLDEAPLDPAHVDSFVYPRLGGQHAGPERRRVAVHVTTGIALVVDTRQAREGMPPEEREAWLREQLAPVVAAASVVARSAPAPAPEDEIATEIVDTGRVVVGPDDPLGRAIQRSLEKERRRKPRTTGRKPRAARKAPPRDRLDLTVIAPDGAETAAAVDAVDDKEPRRD